VESPASSGAASLPPHAANESMAASASHRRSLPFIVRLGVEIGIRKD
jgi:hypothetical protein